MTHAIIKFRRKVGSELESRGSNDVVGILVSPAVSSGWASSHSLKSLKHQAYILEMYQSQPKAQSFPGSGEIFSLLALYVYP